MTFSKVKTLIAQIQAATELKELKYFHQKIDEVLSHEHMTQDRIIDMYDVLNDVHKELTIKALQLAEKKIIENPVGERPGKFCWYLLGSGARFEQTFWTDQDNGILYECTAQNKSNCKKYIQEFAKIGTHYLNDIGYPFCEGDIMATNERWGLEVESLRRNIDRYIENGLPDSVSYLYILSDIKAIYGNATLVQHIKKHFFTSINQSRFILQRMQEHLNNPTVPLGIFGQVFTERWGENSGQINIKFGLYVPLVNSIKFLAIRNSIESSSTLERLNALKNSAVLTDTQYHSVKEALTLSFYFRFLASKNKEAMNHHLLLEQLSTSEKALLKKAMKTAKKFQAFTRHGG